MEKQRFFTVLAAVVVLIILLVGGFWFYSGQEQQLKQHAEDQLQAIAQLKVSQITGWRAERRGDAAVISDNQLLVKRIASWLAGEQTESS